MGFVFEKKKGARSLRAALCGAATSVRSRGGGGLGAGHTWGPQRGCSGRVCSCSSVATSTSRRRAGPGADGAPPAAPEAGGRLEAAQGTPFLGGTGKGQPLGGPPCSTHTPKAVRTARAPHEPGRVAASPLGGGGQRAAVPATGASVPTTEVLVARVARPPPTAMLTWQGASAPTPRGVPGHARRRLPAQAVRRAGQRHVPVGRVWWLAVTAPALCAWPSTVPRDEDVSTPSGAGPRIRPPRDGAQGVTLTPVLAGSCPQLGGTCLTPTAPGA